MKKRAVIIIAKNLMLNERNEEYSFKFSGRNFVNFKRGFSIATSKSFMKARIIVPTAKVANNPVNDNDLISQEILCALRKRHDVLMNM